MVVFSLFLFPVSACTCQNDHENETLADFSRSPFSGLSVTPIHSGSSYFGALATLKMRNAPFSLSCGFGDAAGYIVLVARTSLDIIYVNKRKNEAHYTNLIAKSALKHTSSQLIPE